MMPIAISSSINVKARLTILKKCLNNYAASRLSPLLIRYRLRLRSEEVYPPRNPFRPGWP